MARTTLLDGVIFVAVSAGTVDFVVSAAQGGYMTPATAGATNAQIGTYRAQSADLTQWEEGNYTYTSAGTIVSRAPTYNSTDGGAGSTKVNFTNPPLVMLTPSKGEITNKTGDQMTGALDWAASIDVASGATANIGAANSNLVRLTGTTTVTAFDTVAAGITRVVRAAGILVLTHNATSLILLSGANITTAAGDIFVMSSEGSGNWRMLSYERADGTALVAATGPASLTRSARTANTILGTADKGTFVDITSGTFSQTFTAAATLTNGWWVILRNSGTGDITLDPNGSETIDTLTTFVMYPGEERLITCDGSNLTSIVQAAGAKVFTSSGTFIQPPGYSWTSAEPFGGGGAGVSGGGGTGGGGGARHPPKVIVAPAAGTSITVTVGAGGVASGTPTSGGTSSFGSYVQAFGGGGGVSAGGGGGGILSAGSTSGAGGDPGCRTDSGGRDNGAFGGGIGSINTGCGYEPAGKAVWGGGGGGANGATVPSPSLYGGGGGGSKNSGNVTAGAGVGDWASPTGGGSGNSGGTAGAGAAGTNDWAGAGGGGGTTGGAGGAPSGGGGGGSTTGGAGGRGEVRVRIG